MKVLLVSVNHPELVRGGAQQICHDLFEGLKTVPGVTPTLLAAVDPSHDALYKSGVHLTGFDGRPGEFVFLGQGYDHFWHRMDGDALAEAFEDFLLRVRPDVIHFHHFMLLGVDMLTLARRVAPDARIILTLHEFLAICLAQGQLVRTTDQSVCDRATPIRCHQCFPNISPEYVFLRELWTKRHLSSVDVFTTPSRFMIDIYARWGLDRARLVHVPNGQGDGAVTRPRETPRQARNRFGFFGQIVDNKGVWVVLQAVRLLRAAGFTDFVVELNGDNLNYASEARRTEFEAFMAAEQGLPLEERIVVHNGAYEVSRLPALMGRVDWCVAPSVWPEAFGLVVSEASLFGRPVICSDIGGLGERVIDEENGLHFAVGDARALAAVIRRACEEPGLWDRLADGVKAPTPRAAMVSGFLELYRGGAPS